MRILLVEDDPVLSDGIKVGLGMIGWTIDHVSRCGDAQAAIAATEFDAVVLDLMLPDGSGLDVLADIRLRRNATPVLLLTALDDTKDRVRGLDAGADDYLGKPFDLAELAARLRSIVRRRHGRTEPVMKAAGIILDPAKQTAERNGKLLALSRREFAVLAALMERPGVIRSRTELEDRLYGWQEEIESNAVEVHIHNLRNKLGRDIFETVRGVGYRIRVET